MIKVEFTLDQKNEIENLYWEWFNKYHLNKFKEIISKDSAIIKHLSLESLDDENIKKVLLSSPVKLNKLKAIIDNSSNIIKSDSKDYILRRYHNIRETVAPKILKVLNIRSCPYCNQNYVYTYSKNGKLFINGELDHYYNKSDYPQLAICLYNLIPCCSTCNKLKSNKRFKMINPYDLDAKYHSSFQTCFDDHMDINYLIGLSNNFKIDIDLNWSSREEIEEINELLIKERYQLIEKAKNIIIKSIMYNKIYIDYMQENFDIRFIESDEIFYQLFNICNRDIEESFSKFNKDILKEFLEVEI